MGRDETAEKSAFSTWAKPTGSPRARRGGRNANRARRFRERSLYAMSMRPRALGLAWVIAGASITVVIAPTTGYAAKPPPEKAAPPAPLRVDVETAEQLYAKLE